MKQLRLILGEFKPVTWACRAPLPSGRLCPRKGKKTFFCLFMITNIQENLAVYYKYLKNQGSSHICSRSQQMSSSRFRHSKR